jgi:hypothetical protein
MLNAISHGAIETLDVGGEELDALGPVKEVKIQANFVIRAESLQEFEDKLNQLINMNAV